MTVKKRWSYKTGVGNSRVVVEETPKSGVLQLRWWDSKKTPANWSSKSLGRRLERDERGRIVPESEAAAVADANSRSLELQNGTMAPGATAKPTAFTIGMTEAAIIDKDTGKYPDRTGLRDELVRSLRTACALWGADTAWIDIEEKHWTLLLRRRLEKLVTEGHSGWRATEITVGRLITCVHWLRRKKLIPRDAAQWPDEWKRDIKDRWKALNKSDRDPKPDRPRYTLEEFQSILNHADFDPRLQLLLRMSAGLRPGQVARLRRSDLKAGDGTGVLPAVDWNAPVVREEGTGRDLTDYGTYEVFGAGKKRGVLANFTRRLRREMDAALAGYLADFEHRYRAAGLKDYVIFPAGYVAGRVAFLRNKPVEAIALGKSARPDRAVTGSWIRSNWRRAEKRAGVPHQRGRATYGGRRLTVDIAKKMKTSLAGIKAVGGWTDNKMPEQVYAESTNEAGRLEAMGVRDMMIGDDE